MAKKENDIPRKPQPLDWELVGRLASLQCTQEEIAHGLKCSADILQRRAPAEVGETLTEYMKRHAQGGKISLRRWQWRAAEGGNITMLIWLGKQYLAQTDKMLEERMDHVNVKLEAEVKELMHWWDGLEKAKAQ